MRTMTFIGMMVMLMALVSVTAYGNEKDASPMESLYGEWWLVGWNEKGAWCEADTNYVSHRHLSIEIPEEGVVMAYSMVNEIIVGELTVNGNGLIFSGGGCQTKVWCDVMENLFFEDHICDIKSYQLEGNLLRLYYTDNDYFVFTNTVRPIMSGTENIPFVQDGKRWNYKGTLSGVDPKYEQSWKYSYYLNGDTVVGDNSCLKLYYEGGQNNLKETYQGAMYEKEGKVFFIAKGETSPCLLYDFGCCVGDKFDTYCGLIEVEKTQVVSYQGKDYRKIFVQDMGLWIEGVGSIYDMFTITLPDPGEDMQLVSCELNGEIIFDYLEFADREPSPSPDLTQIRIKENPSETLEYIGKIGNDYDSALDYLRKMKGFSSDIIREPLEVIFVADDRLFWGIVYDRDCGMYSDVLDSYGNYYLRTWHSSPNEADGVIAPTTPEINGNISHLHFFDLSGHRLAKPTKRGVYIKDGKKVLVK